MLEERDEPASGAARPGGWEVAIAASLVEKARVVVADDDQDLASEIVDYVARYEFQATAAATWGEACAEIAREPPDAIILDQFLADVDTLTRLPELRRLSGAPIILLTMNREVADRILGLELGADDYLSKPVSGRELVARLRAQLRRSRLAPPAGPRWRLDQQAQRLVGSEGRSIPLTTAETGVLWLLAEAPGRVRSRDDLSLAVFRRPWRHGDRAIDTIVANLRAKLDGGRPGVEAGGRSCIATVRNLGYQFVSFPD